jgi:predicted enzyme related to lactoylglutathione lyase
MTAPAALSPVLGQIGQISIVAHDLPRATSFYRDALGLPFLFEAPGLAFFQCGGVRLMLSGAETPEFDHPASILYFDVADIEAAHRTLAGRGVKFRDAPHPVHRANDRALWMAFFEDSEGNVFAIMSWRLAA